MSLQLRDTLWTPGFVRPSQLLSTIISLFARAVKFSPLLYRASQEVMQAHFREADRIFQDVDALVCLEGSHLFQSFLPWRYIEIIVVAQPICKCLHALFFNYFHALLNSEIVKT